MTENRQYRTEQYAMRADVDQEGLLKVRFFVIAVAPERKQRGTEQLQC